MGCASFMCQDDLRGTIDTDKLIYGATTFQKSTTEAVYAYTQLSFGLYTFLYTFTTTKATKLIHNIYHKIMNLYM